MKKKLNFSKWFVYMLECSDKSIYTGITNDLEARIIKHNSGKGAKYTRGRIPVILKKFFEFDTKSEALKAEYCFKKLTRIQKLKLISGKDNR